ncbi:MAG: isopentenyl-diphosphate Delta-isomerase [Lentimicrobium sp.]|jgi:isopentenyl-diphosphate delta-isomerase|nr:isopentenyl-diphosphate Delta-isomerase [Lentimicrobium sp.]MDD2527045.1 isopentenyl-diphosphate Delta-isomerase [Lentimicrobiaceae bacterium]MDD4597636.1 isopentenyl-diphosphate Delta-isomerase [Lentimicrobiaceae bacterium]MDY0026300.1 isopentenyl-diphosphate Delta-isomerase [Lentimicrobium sp.]
MEEFVILVDENDHEIGKMEKLQAHVEAKLHRAFSVFIFNSRGELLLQQRAFTKYHTPGLWTNTCCSHPRPGEATADAAHRRMVEEMGFDCDFEEVFSFMYKARFTNELTEHEIDHVFIGFSDTQPVINPTEVQDYHYANMNVLAKEIKDSPENFTIWFRIAFDRVREYFEKHPLKPQTK